MKTFSLKEMKKVAAMFVAVACISISALGAMQEKNAVAQASLGCAYMAGESEDGAAGAWGAAFAMTSSAAGQIAIGGTILGWNPVGWGMWVGAGACAL